MRRASAPDAFWNMGRRSAIAYVETGIREKEREGMTDERRDDTAQNKRKVVEKLSQYSALFISVIALGTAIWSAMETRRHDRLSLRPGVSYVWHTSSVNPEGVGIFIENSGSGPAEVAETRVYLDSKLIGEWQQISSSTQTLYNGPPPTWYTMKRGYILGNGKKIGIYSTPVDNVKDWDNFIPLIRQRIFAISKICSMYGDCYYVCSNADDDYCLAAEDTRKRS
jgi:hypothetical protein